MDHSIQLAGGRQLAYRLGGAEDGIPLIWIHGTPGFGAIYSYLNDRCLEKGVKLVAVTRAGYGTSTRDAGRRVVNFVADIEALTKELGLPKVLVAGWSGGGPHALACAARLPGCVAALAVASVAPYDADGLDFLAGQGEDNVAEFTAALAGEKPLREFVDKMRPELIAAGVDGIIESMSSLLPTVDVDVLRSDRSMGEYVAESFSKGLATSTDGWVDDDLAFVRPWGFDVAEIKVPVALYQGSEDRMVPFAHGEWLANKIPSDVLKAHLCQGEGHISIFVNNVDKQLDELLAHAR